MEMTKKRQNAPKHLYGDQVKGIMRRLVLLMLVLLPFTAQKSNAIDIEARTGVSFSDIWGLHAGAYVNFPQSELFSIQTGLLLHTIESSVFRRYEKLEINVFAPAYASFHLPVGEKAKIRLNAGVYVGTGYRLHAGVTGEVGVEINRFYVGANCFQNCVRNDMQLGLTFGYSFSLSK